MLNCVIIDDEPLAQDILAGYIKQVPYAALVRQYTNVKDALLFFRQAEADVLFLDIEMPELSGIDFLRSLTNAPLTVFTTAYRDYAFEGFELGVVDFLLKPFSFDRFLLSMERIKEFLVLQKENSELENTKDTRESIFVKSGLQKIRLFFSEVTHIQGLKDYAIIHTVNGRVVIKGSVKSMHDIFPETAFIRVHKSFIVAKDKIKRIEKNRIIIGNHEIPVGRNYKPELERQILRS
ncbi:MAG TPA: LytTR family DNA-binding domain-containing protein [Puia sp.]|nr:LytTR family DNA-binding domain-containing protein [Puia sp.]